MTSELLQQVNGYHKHRRRKKLWLRVVSVLASVVVFCTSYALILPAITKERTAYCGLTEHQHSDTCFAVATPSFTCSSPHVHGDECLNENGEIVCGMADYVLHTHSDLCFNESGECICPLDERAAHTHTEECYALPESNELQSDEITTDIPLPALVCGLDEVMIHLHEEACFDENGAWICGFAQLTEHNHTQDCMSSLTVSDELICTQSEHTHTDDCFVDLSADVETEEDWLATLPVNLSGDWSQDTAAVALSQLGYRESAANTITDEYGLVHGYNRYGAWYGDGYAPWNTLFAVFCLHYAGVDASLFPYNADASAWREALNSVSLFTDPKIYTPRVGDIVFFDDERVAVVTEYTPATDTETATITVIEGDLNNAVTKAVYAAQADTILGYGNIRTAYDSYAVSKPIQKEYRDDTVMVTASFNSTADIPQDAELVVRPIVQTDAANTFDLCLHEAQTVLDRENGQTKLTQIKDFRLFDIYFEYNGEEIQPSSAVDIAISFLADEDTDTESVSVVHYIEDGAELSVVTECALDEDGNLSTVFETESFSLFAVVTAQTSTVNIVTLEPYAVTASNVSALAGTSFAVALEDLALGLDANGNLLATETMIHVDTGDMTADESLARWRFERVSGSNYRLYTVVDGVNHYLSVSGTSLMLVSSSTNASTFTATRNGTGLTLQNSGSYLNLTAPQYSTVTDEASGVTTTQLVSSGVSMGSSAVLSLYTLPGGSFTVTFDGKLSDAPYMDKTQNHKYSDGIMWSETTDANGYITLPTEAADDSDDSVPGPGNHPLKLNGWFDIINGVYYDSSMLGQRIKVTSNTTSIRNGSLTRMTSVWMKM